MIRLSTDIYHDLYIRETLSRFLTGNDALPLLFPVVPTGCYFFKETIKRQPERYGKNTKIAVSVYL